MTTNYHASGAAFSLASDPKEYLRDLGYKKVLIKTYGCQMNVRDSELIREMLEREKYVFVESEDEADIILFNTCSVRDNAEQRVLGNINSLKSWKKKDSKRKIGVLGCMAQRMGNKLLEDFKHVDMVVGPSNIYEIPSLMPEVKNNKRVLATDKNKRPDKTSFKEGHEGAVTAFVNITYGCNNGCSFCIVPFVRGREVSRPQEEILDEIKGLVDKGYKEVTLLGQNVNSYGTGNGDPTSFIELLRAVDKINGMKRIRYTTNHPKDANKDLFMAVRDSEHICNNFHLPMQSGSDKILDLMRRQYTYAHFKEKVDALRDVVPDAYISTDIIVGFPGETIEEYNKTKDAMKEICFNSAYIFKYSPRPPAKSYLLEDDVAPEEKNARNNDLLELQREISLSKNREMVGTKQEILAEEVSKFNKEKLIGRCLNSTPCVFKANERLVGEFVSVDINDTSATTLRGEIDIIV